MKAILAAALLLAATPALAQTASQAPAATAPAPCAGPERAQFDFWVGRWNVYPTGSETLVAHSLIEKLYGGCAIRENWMPLKGTGGGSLSAYTPQVGWRQIWTDSSGAWAEFKGGFSAGAMVLEGMWPGVMPDGSDAIVRMTYTAGADGSVRQLGQTSVDGGKSWQPSFDFTYRPARS